MIKNNSHICHDMFLIFLGKRRRRQSIDASFNMVSYFLRILICFNDFLKVSWGKKCLRQSIDDPVYMTYLFYLLEAQYFSF